MESRIGILMDTFSISGKDLAALLHIDSSLVSKWKSGKRAFRPNSVYTSQIIKHVMALDSNNQYAKIKLILSSEYAGIHNASENEIALFLKDWLISGNNKSGGASNTLDEIKNLKSISPLSFYSIAGNNGRRQVLQFFQKYAMSLNTTCDIWIYSTESKRWMYEDSAYHDELQSRYISLLEKGCRIRIIHAMSGSYESLAQSMLTWLPMHMTGRTQAYFIPRYKYEQLGYTYFLLKDHLAVYNWSPKMNQGDVNTYITHEKQMIKDIEVMMEEYFS